MRKPSLFLTILFVITVLSAQWTASGVWADTREVFQEQIDPGRGAQLTVKNVNGSVTVKSDDIDYIRVKAEKKTNKGQDELDKVGIDISNGDDIVVEVVVLDRGLFNRHPKVSVDFEITVPRELGVKRLESVNGRIRASEIAGDLTARTTNGKVIIERPADRITARTTNGSIEVNEAASVRKVSTTNGSVDVSLVKPFTGDCEIKTVNGSVKVAVPFDLDADVDLGVVNGSVNVSELSLNLHSATKKSLKAKLRSGGPEIRVRTTNGSIRLRRK